MCFYRLWIIRLLSLSIWIPNLALPCYMTLSKWLNISVLPFSYLCNKGNNTTCLIKSLSRLHKLINAKGLEQCLAQSKPPINIMIIILLILFEVLCETQKRLKFLFNYKQIIWPTHKQTKASPSLPYWPFALSTSHSSSGHLQLTLYLRAASNSFSTGRFCLHLDIYWSTEHRVLWMVLNYQTIQRGNENNSPKSKFTS